MRPNMSPSSVFLFGLIASLSRRLLNPEHDCKTGNAPRKDVQNNNELVQRRRCSDRGLYRKGIMLGMPFCGHLPALAPLPLSRGHDCRSATFKTQTQTRSALQSRCRAAKDADELQLVSREGKTLSMPINLHADGSFPPGDMLAATATHQSLL